eukprot:m.115457 g.115457  ORF g.115457 m.115457 type:complete len:55 (+) comp13568_c0_seq4:269-433(+)
MLNAGSNHAILFAVHGFVAPSFFVCHACALSLKFFFPLIMICVQVFILHIVVEL